MLSRPVVPIALVAVFGTLPLAAGAQAPTASLTGVVSDTLGTPVAGAAVTARNVETGLSYATESTEAGDYWLGGLPPGTYEVRAERIGYAPTVRPSVALSVGTTLRMNISLRVRAISLDPIEVVAAPPVVETTESDVSFVLDHERIARLPEESRQFLDLALLAPGATAAPDNPEAVPTTQIGALNAYSVGVLVDGGQLVHGGNNDYAGSFPLLAIREFEVLTGGFAAEFGQAASGVVNAVTRRGTNDFSVESFGLYRNHRLNATGAFEAEKPEYERTHWGLAAGGPLERDRTHFFVAAERRTEDAFETVSTDGAFPALEGTFKVPFESTLVFARLDHRLAPDHDLTLRYGGELSTRRTDVGPSTSCAFFGGGNLASEEYGVEIEKDMHSLLGKHRWSLGGGALNEVTVHWVGTWERRARLTDGPMLKYPSLCTGGNQFAWDTPNHRFELREDVSVVRSGAGGTHRLKVGAHLAVVDLDNRVSNFENGVFLFDADTASLPSLFIRELDAPFGAEERNVQLAFYVQDAWSPVPRLTLNLGLRYDVETNGTNQGFVNLTASELPFVPSEPRPVDKDKLAPRLGLAWDVLGDGSAVVRGGAGIFYDQLTVWRSGLESRGGSRAAFVPNPGSTDVEAITEAIDPETLPPLVTVMDPEMMTPLTRQFSLGVEGVLPGGVVASMDGLLVQGRNLILGHARNPFVDPALGVRKYPDFGPVTQIRSAGRAEGKILMVRARKAWSRGGIDVHYTLAERKATVDRWFDFIETVPDTATDFSSEFGPAD